ncbi:putative pentatricopeptide repeat-containing protein [Cocos nucifera]|uniref:Putative pentatricopeptide repeat-containing protein n=1 Tax=Cocos nucifera TaxID=13894 RepID=A0A8K0HZ91_COCNU|nr:putative pentatricopeptide repeat-containing protein [Cocos nucifera]
MFERDIVLWNIMIKMNAQMDLVRDVFFMFSELHCYEIFRLDDASVHCILMDKEIDRNAEQVRVFRIKSCLFNDSSDLISWNKTMSEYVKGSRLVRMTLFWLALWR